MSLWKLLTARWGSSAGEIDEIRIDASTNTLQTITYEHHEVHSGSHFTCTENATLNIADVSEVLIYTPNTTKWAHMIFEVNGVLHTQVDFYEGSTHNADSAKSCRNNNRNSVTMATTTLNASADDGGDGTNIYTTQFGADDGTGINRITSGGTDRGSQEWVLKQNEKYLLKVTSLSDSNSISIRFGWYEHTDKNGSP